MKNKINSHFFIVGAQRCGTTSLHHYLSKHPQICMGSEKEIHYYSIEKKYIKGMDWYKSRFNNCSENIITGDASPLYLYLDYVPARIAKDYKNAKLIFILRNPADRAWSHYSWQVKRGLEYLSFSKAIKKENKRISKNLLNKRRYSYLDRGKYIVQIKRYLKYFPKEQMLFIFTKDLKTKPKQVLNNICKFLEVEEFPVENISKVQINKNQIARFKFIAFVIHNTFLERNKYAFRLNKKLNQKDNNLQIKKETQEYMSEYFRDYNQELKDFLNIEQLNW